MRVEMVNVELPDPVTEAGLKVAVGNVADTDGGVNVALVRPARFGV